MYTFMKGLDLSKRFYFEVVKNIVETGFPNLQYSASLIGYGSDVIGLDNATSMDHNWGPRCQLFVNDPKLIPEIKTYLSEQLPEVFLGFPTNFSIPSPDGTQRMEAKSGKINHLIEVTTIEEYFNVNHMQLDAPFTIKQWLNLCDQQLMELTSGLVFHDGLNKLEIIRKKLKFYPQEIVNIRMASLWECIGNEEAFVGRSVELSDLIGLKLIVSRITNYLIKICFYIDGQYIPYSKWFGSCLLRLSFPNELKVLVESLLTENDINLVESKLVELYDFVIKQHNLNNDLPNLRINVENYYGRPYKVLKSDRIVDVLLKDLPEELNEVSLKNVAMDIKMDGVD